MSTDADTEPLWVLGIAGLGVLLGVLSLAMLTSAANNRRKFLANAIRVAMSLEAYGFNEETRKQSRVEHVDVRLLVEALGLRDALLASGDVREAERLNAALPLEWRQA